MVVSKELTEAYRELKVESEGFLLLMQVGAFMQVKVGKGFELRASSR